MSGNCTVEFEAWLAKYNHVRYAITCHSGTQALEIIAGYYFEEARDRGVQHPTVLLPSLTYVATANAWLNAGWEVRFVDVDQAGIFSLRNNSLEFDDFDAICLVGLYGASITHIADVKLWREMMLHNKIITEDAAQHWLSAGGVRVGVAAAVSFDPTKNLGNFGNGGAVITDSSDIMHYARGWRDNGKNNEHHRLGTNSRMSELDCAHMLVKTRYIDQWQRRRAAIVSHWMDRLKNTGVRCLITDSNYHDHCFHKFVIDCEYRDDLQKFLTSQGIETKVHYELPLHEQGIYRQWPNPGYLSNASVLSRRVLSLPIYPELTDLEVEYIIDSVVDYASTKHT
jgi:dTDP-4-amino-4,6-dideoxygalactose transaminase